MLIVGVFMICVIDSLPEFLARSEEYVYKLADNLLDALTNGEHSKTLRETEPVSKDRAKTVPAVTTAVKMLLLFVVLCLFSLPQVVEERNSQAAKKDTEV